ncbi:MAG: type II toxin-antitoxin system Phd/YefM family antitoxin [Deltaproteobacteria bacterium]|nr:type II toxin-antitoxin system Phd/YefM family antitoxin [Deltaproteobacteria bacterium]
MNKKWQLQEAKNKFSNLVEIAKKEGPQLITKNGKDAVVVLSADEYKKLIKPKTNLVEFMQKSPLKGVEIDINRNKTRSRNIDDI